MATVTDGHHVPEPSPMTKAWEYTPGQLVRDGLQRLRAKGQWYRISLIILGILTVIGIIARRLPKEPPFDSTTIVDIVSTAGSTLRVVPWTANKPEEWARLVDLKVDAIISDYPRQLVEYLKSR